MERNSIVMLGLLLVFVGCDHHRYEIAIQPQGEVFARQVKVEFGDEDDQGRWSAKPVPAETTDRLERLYQQTLTPSKAGPSVFSGTFEQVPADLGGSGSYLYLSSPLGDGALYVERFGGRLNQAQVVQQAFDAADELTEALIGWFEQESAGAEPVAEICALLDMQVRQDLKNLALIAWSSQIISAEEWLDQQQLLQLLGMRAGQYIVDRGYLRPRELPALMRAIQDISDTSWSPELLEIIRHRLMDMAGLSAGQLSELQFLQDAQQAAASLVNYFEHRGIDVKEIAERLLPLALVGSSDDKIVLHLNVPTKPIITNGQYDPAKMTVTWSRRASTQMESEARMAPLAYAVWAHPNETYQTERLGSMLLTDQDLAGFLLWYSALTDAERQEWDGFIASLRSDESLAEQLRFRFSTETDSAGSHADWPLELIRRATSRK